MSEATFKETIITEEKKGGWTYLRWKESVAVLGTGKATKVEGTIDGKPFQATLLPSGNGDHFLPLRAAILKATGKKAGDEVEVTLSKVQS